MAYTQLLGSDITIRIKKESTSKSFLSRGNKEESQKFVTFNNLLRVKAVSDTISTATKATEYYVFDRNFSLEDNYQGQRDLGIAKTVFSNAISVGKAALIGASFGPLGAVAGAAAAVVSISVNAGIKLNQQDIKITQMNTQLSFSREKAGYSLTLEGNSTLL